MNAVCNIFLLGKSGVGKSALVNYLTGKKIAASHASCGGVTRGVRKYPLIINGRQCMISDSEGLETGSDWNSEIMKNLFATSEKNIMDWYHVVIYCISASGARVQDFDINAIRKVHQFGYGVIIAFTKSNNSSTDDTQRLKEVIEEQIPDSNFSYIEIDSVTEDGADAFGKDEISKAIISQWGKTVFQNIPSYVFDWSIDESKTEIDIIKKFVWAQEIRLMWGRSKEDVMKDVNEKIESYLKFLTTQLEMKMKNAFDELKSINETLNTTFIIENNQESLKIDNNFHEMIKNENANQDMDGSEIAGAIIGGVLALPFTPIIVPIMFLVSAFNDGSDTKREICKKIDEAFSKLERYILIRKSNFTTRLNILYGGN